MLKDLETGNLAGSDQNVVGSLPEVTKVVISFLHCLESGAKGDWESDYA
jgi:hypothetical protein